MKYLICLLVSLLLMGCATTYSPKKGLFLPEGYEDTKIQDDTFRVIFYANADTSMNKTKDFALLRCAEVTLENNYEYFTIIESEAKVTEGPANIATMYMPAQYPEKTFLIKCFNDKPTIFEADTVIYNAEEVKTNIKSKYKLK